MSKKPDTKKEEQPKSPFGQMVEKLKSNRWSVKTNPFGDLHYLTDNGLITQVFVGDTGYGLAQEALAAKSA